MTITASLVLFSVIWFMLLFIVLPIRMQSQQDTGDVVPGTPASAPENPQLKKRALIVTALAIPLWLFSMWLILSGLISLDTLDFYNGINPKNQ